MTISATGLAALERVIADNPNCFNAVARETLESLLERGRAIIAVARSSRIRDELDFSETEGG